MSSNTNFNSAAMAAARPQHHVHGSSDPLPGTRGADPSVDYSADTIEHGGPNTTWNERDERQFTTGQMGQHRDERQFGQMGETGHQQMQQQQQHHAAQDGQNVFNSDRPMNVQPTAAGGVAIGGRSDLPEGHASATDKLVGKTQKVIGKMTGKPEMHEKGELRETGGKAAAQGGARAAHD
ncbi:hypothetical protein E1B28_013610 [Marasmius oreades]|uniref:CsbD-like domain-containing protein n=1 Tax=Marasmius oreades TaxID=181124 RepID=A0A9P7UME4_9AGAR|nr:uncharacterized protein E1B28_013610 [Marasmius oreades]KAG7087662.1 hypothetical protein E1B28_013610 [Marasmius oreades]